MFRRGATFTLPTKSRYANIMQGSEIEGTEINYFAGIYEIFAVWIYVFTE